jgi:asparagine synthase (glutamine-hydrolysing)
MCGIAVAIDWEGAEATVRRLINGLLHRGDVTDPLVIVNSQTAMCTRRLRIVDATNGAQPQASFDERFLVSLNGEIYNHAELRAELAALGVPFYTACDTEVVANVLRAWGHRGVARLSGMYAFVAIDTVTGEFLAARDPFGVKPLYAVQGPKGYLFCSEIGPLLDVTEDDDVLLVPPGYMLTRNFCGRHYELPAPTAATIASPQELDRLLSDAVARRLPAGLPVAALFSGGIDSTLVLHYARRHRPDVPGYIAAGRHAPDRAYARRYADATGLDLREVPVEAQSAETLALLATIVGNVESFEPAVIRPSLYTYLIAQRMHEDGFRVALCGEGADEIFAGYTILEDVYNQANGAGRFVQDQCLSMMHRASLQRVDRCSMRFQLEIREPFLDLTLVNYASGLDGHSLIGRGGDGATGKAPLRALYNLYPRELPSAIRDRRKMPFDEGAGTDVDGSGWSGLFDEAISDADFRDGQRAFADFSVRTKEELFYIRALASKMDISRIPHLRERLRLDVPLAA